MSNAQAIKAGKAEVELTLNEKVAKGLASAREKLKGFHAFLATTNINGFELLKKGMGGVLGVVKSVGIGVAGMAGSLLGAAKVFAETDRRILNPEEAKAADKMRLALSGVTQSTQQTVAALVMQLQPSIQAIIDIIRLVMQSIKDWIKDNKALFDSVNQVIVGIRDALMSGNWKLAANILWAGLKVAWAAGIAALAEPWSKWKTSFQQTASDAFHGIQHIANDVWAGLQKGFANFTAFFQRAWASVVNWFYRAWSGSTNWLAKKLIDAETAVGRHTKQEAEDIKQTLDDMNERRVNTANEERDKAIKEADAKQEQLQKEIEDARQKKEEAIANKNILANKLISEANKKGVEDAKKNLLAAQEELKKLTDQARKEAKQKAKELPKIVDLKAQFSTAGVTDSGAIRGLQGNKPFAKVEEYTRKTAEQTERTAKAVEKQQGPQAQRYR